MGSAYAETQETGERRVACMPARLRLCPGFMRMVRTALVNVVFIKLSTEYLTKITTQFPEDDILFMYYLSMRNEYACDGIIITSTAVARQRSVQGTGKVHRSLAPQEHSSALFDTLRRSRWQLLGSVGGHGQHHDGRCAGGLRKCVGGTSSRASPKPVSS
jgi:hypothetical protein